MAVEPLSRLQTVSECLSHLVDFVLPLLVKVEFGE